MEKERKRERESETREMKKKTFVFFSILLKLTSSSLPSPPHFSTSSGRRPLALAVQSRVSEVLHVDIHPGARVGRGVMIDHATGVVVGETAVVGDGVSLLHHVTLGGSGTGRGARHPHIGDGALLGAGVCVLGPVTVGAGSKVGAGSVVVTDLPPHCVAVGVPARIVRTGLTADPSSDMNAVDDFDWVI